MGKAISRSSFVLLFYFNCVNLFTVFLLKFRCGLKVPKWRIKLDFEQITLIIDPKVAKAMLK
jgi:hypothetical protein